MSKLPVISGKKTIQALEKAGWIVVRQKGSHVILVKSGRKANLSVPLHKELDPGTLRGLIKDAGISVTQFIKLLK